MSVPYYRKDKQENKYLEQGDMWLLEKVKECGIYWLNRAIQTHQEKTKLQNQVILEENIIPLDSPRP